ncbi:MAG: bifunctional diaminohydroxyphosphoribosylaminopyrimidine deaminase/5-amino-6-(5-phosphoribosylamino)uracil reductase RibD [candidate division Zixibacteria bacterium]|nr:bifunctional diaminohydroxyphosphoribosylaminopyrimidine deaminase/5-amino-6-(5-phosphoribosylamino)uracil reductase RibD [Candidatus Tariuqbacter arcticus]
MSINDSKYIRRCLKLAQRGAGYVSPNPKVGAVVMVNGEIISEGWHQKYGGRHAEVRALENLSSAQLREAILYVNLEPCCFQGKTPPCTELIIGKGVPQVVIGMLDPNPKVNGKGIEKLRQSGINVEVGVLERKCRELNRGYIKHITTGLPEVILKTAVSLDGRIGAVSGDSRWITGKPARIYMHKLRSEYDAIMVGVRTVLADNPMLNVRHIEGRSPLRVILDSRLRTPLNAKVLTEQEKLPTIIFTSDNVPQDKIGAYTDLGSKVIQTPLHPSGYLSLPDILKHLGRLGVTTVLVEGGATVFTSFLNQELADRLMVVIAPKIIGADGIPVIGNLGISRMSEVESWKFNRIKRLGGDVLLDIILKEY